jgi:RNA polymerase sigma factor (sigma-70 family)
LLEATRAAGDARFMMGRDSHDDDVSLVQRWQDGDRDACANLFARHHSAVRAFIISRSSLDADDLAQRTFVAFLEARGRFRLDASVRTFLIAIADRQIRVDRRKGARDFSSLAFLAIEPASPLVQLTMLEGERRLTETMDRLPPELLRVVLLHYWHEMTAAEIARLLEIPQGTVASRLRRARERLRAMFEGAVIKDLPNDTHCKTQDRS